MFPQANKNNVHLICPIPAERSGPHVSQIAGIVTLLSIALYSLSAQFFAFPLG